MYLNLWYKNGFEDVACSVDRLQCNNRNIYTRDNWGRIRQTATSRARITGLRELVEVDTMLSVQNPLPDP